MIRKKTNKQAREILIDSKRDREREIKLTGHTYFVFCPEKTKV